MAIDLIILVLLLGFTIYGFASGFVRNICSLAFPVLGIWVGFKRCDALAPLVDRALHNYPVSAVIAFLIIILLVWLLLRVSRNLLMKLWDWGRLGDLDQFLGAIFGLAKGLVIVWLFLAASLLIFPTSVQLIQESRASVRILALAEHLFMASRQHPAARDFQAGAFGMAGPMGTVDGN